MKNFDRVAAKKIREEIDLALEGVGKKYNIDIHAGSCRFSEIEMSYKLKVQVKDVAAVEEKNAKEWARSCEIRGFAVEDLGKTFMSRGSEYEITGLELGRRKYDLKAKKLDNGKEYLFASEQIAKKFKKVDEPTTSGFNERNADLKGVS